MCGIFGIFGHPEASKLAALGLHALQHRGQESAGLVTSDGGALHARTRMGLATAGFSQADFASLPGASAIGHVRYATTGDSTLENAQPLVSEGGTGAVAVAHNGNLTNHAELRAYVEASGAQFRTGLDTEVILRRLEQGLRGPLDARVVEALRGVEGAYSLVFLDASCLVAVRDPSGFRPLCLGRLPGRAGEGRDAHVVASEGVAFELIGAEFVRELEPGELLVIDATGVRSARPFAPAANRLCIFEYVYFARPDSVLGGVNVSEVRKRCGRRVIEEHPVAKASAEDCVVVPVPESGVPAAIGLSSHAGLPYELGLVRNRSVGRTFIEAGQSVRDLVVKLKFSPNRAAVSGKRVIVVDDSIVRATTSRSVVGMLRAAGAREVHVRIASPPMAWPCFYGIDTPSERELLAASQSVDEIRSYLAADSLGYLSLAGLEASVREAQEAEGRPGVGSAAPRHCHACFSGNYPVPIGLRGG